VNPTQSIDFNQWIPLFPLPNTVLLPGAVLPLHIFEMRYRKMTENALAGSRLIAIALLKPGFEPNYHRPDAEIHSAVGVGRILREERLADGRFNFLLQGLARAKVVDENRQCVYRKGKLAPLAPALPQPEQECEIRRRLRRMLKDGPLSELAAEKHWTQLLECPELTLSCLLDVLGHLILPDSESKQAFLETPSICKRADILSTTLCRLAAKLMPSACLQTAPPRSWPPQICEN